MTKRILILMLALLLLCGCVRTEQPVAMVQPISFYYRTAQIDYSAEDGVIRAEVIDLGENVYTDLQIFRRYFEGPVSKELLSPISQDTELTDVSRSGSRLDIHLKQDTSSPAELDHTLTYACLAKTGLALEGVSKVRIYINYQDYSERYSKRYIDYTANSILLYDNSEAANTVDVTLYYADENGNLLLPEKRTVPLMSDADLASYLMDLLCSQPQSGGMQSPLPSSTALMEPPSLQNGVCTLDFYPDFCENASSQEQAQNLTVLSIVNTLCKLESVNQVQILVYGERISPGEDSPYRFLDLSVPWSADSAVVGPVREELGEFLGVLCLPGQFDSHLHRLTVRARAKSGVSREEALLQMLFSRTAQNGLSIPFSDTASIVSVSTTNKVCTASLGPGSLPVEETTRTLAIQSIVATLSSLPEVESVILVENDSPVFDAPILPQDEWYLQ